MASRGAWQFIGKQLESYNFGPTRSTQTCRSVEKLVPHVGLQKGLLRVNPGRQLIHAQLLSHSPLSRIGERIRGEKEENTWVERKTVYSLLVRPFKTFAFPGVL